MAGTENQCIGVANALNIDAQIKRTSLTQPWKSLSPYLKLERPSTFTHKLEPPWPDILITSGRKSIAASRYIRKESKRKTFTVHIQDPRVSPKYFDLVAVPSHDPLRGDNVIVTHAAPNIISPDKLQQAYKDFAFFEQIPSPRVAVLIGGKSKAYDMSVDSCKKIIEQLSNLKASFMVTCSRRTGEENYELLKKSLQTGLNFFWDGQGDNPYLGILSWADYILVTADSASMISESCTTGKPVYMIEMDGGAKRIDTLHKHLIKQGCLKRFKGKIDPYTYEPLSDAQMIANEIKKRFGYFTQARI